MIHRSASRSPRGQATVELALGSLVLVTVLVAGVHFAEYGFLWVKLEETANFALFDETNRKMHDTYADSWNDALGMPEGKPVADLNTSTRKRYRNFDGLSSAGGSTITQVFTRGSKLTVNCTRYKGPDIDVLKKQASRIQDAYAKAAREDSGMDCQVSASLSTFRFPTHFADGKDGKFFKRKTIDDTMATPTACAAGRPSGGKCDGSGFRIVLDDWGFQGQAESRECVLTNSGACANSAYYRMADVTYNASGGSNGSDSSTFAEKIAGFAPTTETPFWMSFRGEESKFTETHPSDGSTKWPTTPYNDPDSSGTYGKAYGKNHDCFLGWKC